MRTGRRPAIACIGSAPLRRGRSHLANAAAASSAVTELSEQGDLILAQQPSISMERLASVADAAVADVAAHGAPEHAL